MAFSLKDLLGDAVRRAQIGREVTAARIVEAANKAVKNLLPEGRKGDAWAASFRDGVVTISCLNAPATQAILQNATTIMDAIKREMPTASVVRVVPRLARGKDDQTVIP